MNEFVAWTRGSSVEVWLSTSSLRVEVAGFHYTFLLHPQKWRRQRRTHRSPLESLSSHMLKPQRGDHHLCQTPH